MKPKILFIMYMPSSVHGAAMVRQYIHDSEMINEKGNYVFDKMKINGYEIFENSLRFT